MAKIGQDAWGIAHGKGSKIKNATKVRKMVVQPY